MRQSPGNYSETIKTTNTHTYNVVGEGLMGRIAPIVI